MKMSLATALLAVVCSLSLTAKADDIQLGIPGYGGNGCPQGSVSATLSPDFKALSILFDQYLAEAAGRKRVDRKSCNLAIPVHVPQGYSISIFQVDTRGFNSLPVGGRSQLVNEYFFAEGRSGSGNRVRLGRTFTARDNGDYLQTDRVGVAATIWTPCGADVNLRINTSMTAMTNARGEQALSTVDSMDVASGMIYHIQWRRCN